MFSGGEDRSKFLRYKEGKRGLGLDASRRRRDDKTVSLRNARRDELLIKKRRDQGDLPHIFIQGGGGVDSNGVEAVPRPYPDPEGPLLPLEVLAELACSDNIADHLRAAVGLRRLLAIESNPPVQEVISFENQKLIARLVAFLKVDSHPNLQFEAAWALTNIACGETHQAHSLIEQHAIEEFIRLVRSPVHDVQEQAVWGIGNVAGDNDRFRDYILAMNGMEPLLALVRSDPPPRTELLRLITWAISNFCRGKPQPALAFVSPAIPVLATLLHHTDPDTVSDAAWAFNYLTDARPECIDMAISLNITPRLVELLSKPIPASGGYTKDRTAAMRVIGNFVTGSDEQTQVVIRCGALIPFRNILIHGDAATKKEVCWTVSNITAGPTHQVDAVIASGVFEVVQRLLSTAEFEVRKEAAWVILNATSHLQRASVERMIELGVVETLADVLKTNEPSLLRLGLDALVNLLSAVDDMEYYNPVGLRLMKCGAVVSLERLEHHSDELVKTKVCELLQTYFEQNGDQAAELEGVDDFNAETMPSGPISFS